MIGNRLRQLRESKHMSQGDIEKRTGLLRCYTSRLENGHTIPNVATLEMLAAAFDVPLWKIFYEGDPPRQPVLRSRVLFGAGYKLLKLGFSVRLAFIHEPLSLLNQVNRIQVSGA